VLYRWPHSIAITSTLRKEAVVKLGTRSLLCGAHQFVLHPLFVAIAWTQLYGFPLDPRLWLAFLLHDVGYFGLSNMDGAEGKKHVELGGRLMSIFGREWGDLTRYHSRSYAALDGAQPSRLCAADKLATCLVPVGLYLFMVNLSGEIEEYMADAPGLTQRDWFALICNDSRKWIARQTLTSDQLVPRGAICK
jgi:hypothetical protein